MRQISVRIGEADVPVIVDDESVEWFPVSYITTKVLLRSGKSALINKNNKDKYNLMSTKVQFSDKNTQMTNCINVNDLKVILQKTHIGRLNANQRISQNQLHEYLKIDMLPVDNQDTEYYLNEWKNDVDDHTRDIIEQELLKKKVKFSRRCSKCGIHYPLTNTFFNIDTRTEKGFTKVCKLCTGKIEYFAHQDEDKNKLIKNEFELCEALSNDDIMTIYDSYRDGKLKQLPHCYQNKESFLRIIKSLYERGDLNSRNLFMSYITKQLKLLNASVYLTITEIYTELFGEDFYYFVWKYPKFSFREIKLTYEIANKIIRNYLQENGIVIKDIFNFDYSSLFAQCRIRKLADEDIGYFIVQLYNHKYPYYMFKNSSPIYYKIESNLLHDLKYLIEKDMNIEISKIPLYLTKTMLQRRCRPIYNYIIANKNGSIYEWVNKLYPNQFIETDFEVNAYREEFGSDEECFIHEILKENFNNVIYNQIHTNRTIQINGMIPDWMLLTDSGAVIVEYFGLYIERQYGNNTRVTEYIEKTHRKIEKYKEISGYRYLFLYPDDLNDDYKGVRQKILKLKENADISMV